MTTLLWLLVAIGAAPLALGLARLGASPRHSPPLLRAGSVVLCALAFNLTFFWQELWLVIPKALTPGLHPILYHNDQDWTGRAPTVELLEGTGALATLVSGLAFSAALAGLPRVSVTWRLFLFWMAFQGMFQSLTQLAVGTLLPGNDVGRALAFLGVRTPARWALLALAVAAMAFAGAWLSRADTGGGGRRALVLEVSLSAMFAIVLIVPFRLPRNVIEVALIPLLVNLIGAGWVALGATIGRREHGALNAEPCAVVGPTVTLCATLLVFQFVLRPGVAF